MLRSLSLISALSLLNAVFPFLLLPILTFQLTVDEYGSLVILETFMAVLTPFIQFSVAGLIVEYFKLSKSDFRLYITNSLLLVIPVFCIFELIVFVSSDFIANQFGLHKTWYLMLPVIILLNVCIQALVTVYQCEKKYKLYSIFLLGPNILTFLLTILLLFINDFGWQSKLFGILISFSIFAVISICLLVKEIEIEWKVNFSVILSNLRFTLPIIPHSVAAGLYFMADRLFISELLGNASVAIYAAGMQLALVMSVVQNSVSKAWTPFVMEFLKKCNNKHESFSDGYSKLYRYMLIACLVVIGLGGIIALAIYISVDYILPRSYEQSKYLGMMLVSGFCLLGFYKVYSPLLWYHKRTGSLSKVTIVVFFINLVLNAVLIPEFGIYGACYATIISIGCQFIFTQVLVLATVKKHLRELEYAS
jgi:O-antigen/teichoic acid export membrane protein